jgi:hypothetical protein
MKKVEYTKLMNELAKGLSEQYGKDNVEVIDTDEAMNNTDITKKVEVNDVRFEAEIKVTYNQIDDWKTSTNKYGHTTEYKAVAGMRSASFEVVRNVNDTKVERFVDVTVVEERDYNTDEEYKFDRYFNFVTGIYINNIEIGKEVHKVRTEDVYYDEEWSFAPLSQYIKSYVLGNGIVHNSAMKN